MTNQVVRCQRCDSIAEYSLHRWCSDCILRLITTARNQGQLKNTNRSELLEACRGVSVMLNTELKRYDHEPWAQRVRAALELAEKGEQQ